MSQTHEKPDLRELTEPRPAAGDQEYLDWAERRIRRSLANDDAHPERREPLAAVMKRFGLR
ncbi:MAG: hypothetical protein ABL307_07460 [Roseitalea porphyridii]|uniref:hypothetical protein n=1 Tax=Roseitalea porphyridii TaxID=1852022 RepID=UPI0032D9884A